MADLYKALRNAHNAGDTQAATRIAAMIKSQQQPPQAPQGANPTQPTTQPQEAVIEDSTPLYERAFNAVGDVAASGGRILAGAVADTANIGVGIGNTVLSGVGSDYRIPTAGYGSLDEQLKPRGMGEEIAAGAAPFILGGEVVAPVKAAEGAGRVARATQAVANNLTGAVASDLSEHNQGDLSVSDIAINSVLPPVVEKVGGALVKGARSLLPEAFGGYSMAEKTANVVNKEQVAKIVQNGNEDAQQAFTTATTDAEGNSILLPSQMFNSQAGNKYIAAEGRDMLRGEKSVYNQRLAQQQSGEGIEQAVIDANTGAVPLQESAQNVTGQFKQQSNQLYNESKANAQAALDSLNVGEMRMQATKNQALAHLDADAQAGRINLNAETRRTLNQLQNTKFDSIDTLDNWKRALNEKASKAYRNGDYNSSKVLKDVLNNLRGEADATIQSINPDAGSIYREADKYFSESVGDFGSGKKSVLGKIADKENPTTAANLLVRGQNADFYSNQIGEALNGAIATGSLDDAARLATEFGSSLGATTRDTAISAATTGANFSPTKFANTLNRLDPQASVASRFAADEQAVNNALLDAVQLTRAKARSTSRITNAMATGAGRVVGAGVGGAVGTVFGGGIGGGAGAMVGERVSKAIGEGLLDRITGTNARAMTYLDFLKDPANAQKVLNITGEQPTEDAIKRAINMLTGSTAQHTTLSTPSVSQAPVVAPVASEDVPQRAQSYHSAKSDEFEPKVTRLYKALSHAETGHLDNRFIRTKAAESGVSTAYGPAQVTVTLAEDFYKRHSGLFNAKERDYMKRFIKQGEMMKHADKDDPVFGYGGTGTLGGKEDRKLYASMVRKMLNQMIKDNDGSLDKTVKRWRGNDNDTAYFAKVRDAFHSS